MAQQPSSTPQPASQGSSLSFTQGFLLGQFSIAVLIFCFIKFFIFGEPPSADDRALHLSSLRRARTLAHQQSIHHRTRSNSVSGSLQHKNSISVIRAAAGSGRAPSISQILEKTYYNVQGHQPESLDWFNVLIAQTIAQLRDDARQDGAILTSLTEVLNAGSKPDWIGEIRVTEIALGDEFPIFSNCRIMPAEDGFAVGGGGSSGGGLGHEESRLQARMDVDLSDVITLGVETTLVLNYPKPRVAVLPVALAVSIIRFSGTLAVSFIPSSTPPSSTSTSSTTTHSPNTSEPPRPSTSSGAPPHRPTTLAFTFLDDYRLDLSVRSLVGSRSRLQDVPKIAQLIESRLHAWFDERAVEPRFQQIALPSLWPRKRNTRGGEEEEEGATSAIIDDDDEDTAATVGAADGQANSSTKSAGPAPAGASSSFIPSTSAATSLETRLEAEGAKLREAEIKAGERQRDGARDAATMAAQGMRWRGDGQQQRERSRLARNSPSGDWSGQRGMPGAMLSG